MGKINMCLRRTELEPLLERTNEAKRQNHRIFWWRDRRRSYFFADGEFFYLTIYLIIYLTIGSGINTMIGTLVMIG